MTLPYETAESLHVPPYSEEAETSVIGGMLVSEEAAGKALSFLTADCFYRPAHRVLFEAMAALSARSEPIDLTTLTHELKERGNALSQAGLYALREIISTTLTAANIEYHSRIVFEKWLKRRLLSATTDIQSDCYASATDIYEVIDRAERRVFEIAEHSTRERGCYSMKRLIVETQKILELARGHRNAGGAPVGIPSGFESLDALTGGFQKSDLIILASRPAMGKSGLVLSMARNIALDHAIPVGFFTLEMSPQQLMLRLLSAESGVDTHALRTGSVPDQEWQKVASALERLQSAPLFIEDTPGLGLLELRARARLMKREHKVELIIIDYLQLMHAPKAERREREVSMISRGLKQLAKELDIPVIALSQLNRGVELRMDKRPILSDLKESGAIEEDSDLVLFIHRPEYYGERYNEYGETTEGMAEINVAKHRNGPTGIAKLSFIKEYARFDNLARREETPMRYRRVANGSSY
jgi:replicative DNA helicase